KAKCTNCGTCVRMCPVEPKAVDWHTGDTSRQPTHRYDRCIRCYCCQEVCPEGAILLQSPFLGRFFSRA
ncbi:MAG: 4Fe-4S dicluster domain-containing protein, partial [Dehalococcoidia bacterium]